MLAPPKRRPAKAGTPNASGIILTGRDSFPATKGKFFGGGGNRLIPAAGQNSDRKRTWPLDFDIHSNVSHYGRRIMMTIGRSLYCSYNVVRGAVNEMAELATSSFVPEYRGLDKDFEVQVHEWLYRHDKICDIAGWPYNARLWRRLLVSSILIDGDVGTAFVRGPDGMPYLQIIPAHRIGSNSAEPYVEGGPYDGARILEGVILGDYSNPLAYRVLTGDSQDYETFQDIPADRMILSFIPQFPGQVRGFSLIGYSGWDFQDLKEAKEWELLAQKVASSRIFQIWNQEGEPEPGADFMTAPAAGSTTAGTPTGLWTETVDGGTNQYFKSSDPNSQIKAVSFDRPSVNQRAFHDSIIREALYAAGWSMDFSLAPDKVGGAALRVLVDKINGTLGELRDLIVRPAVSRFDNFRIPVAMMDLKAIPFTNDWHNIEYVTPARVTSDRKYDTDVTIAQIRAGYSTRSKAAAEQGESEEDVRAENEKSVDDLLTIAERLAAKHPKFTAPAVLALLELITPNGNLPAEAPAPAPVAAASGGAAD